MISEEPCDIMIAYDVTGSARANGVPELDSNLLDKILDNHSEKGGRLGFIIVDKRSLDRPVISVTTTTMKQENIVRPVYKRSVNDKQDRKRKQQYAQDSLTFVADSIEWRKRQDKNLVEFRNAVFSEITKAKVKPPAGTDIRSALFIADNYLKNGQESSSRYAIILSDGIDNQKIIRLGEIAESGAQFLWISNAPIPDDIPADFKQNHLNTFDDALAIIFRTH
jgi:hypothetical protein